MTRIPDQFVGWADLHHPTEVHDRDPVGDEPGERQVVGDEQDADAPPLTQVEHHPQDAAPERHVEHRHRLVRDEHVRRERHGARDGDPLALAARQLVGEPVPVPRGWSQPRVVERLIDAFGALPAGADGMHREGLGNLVGDAPSRVEALVRVLEDDLDAPPVVTQPAAADAGDIRALEQHLATGDGCQPHEGPPGGRLA